MSNQPTLISNKLHSFRNFFTLKYEKNLFWDIMLSVGVYDKL